jgi:hypothetical protein
MTKVLQLTLGDRLERDRLERRAVRLEAVVAALRARMDTYDASGAEIPRPLRDAATTFQQDLAGIHRRLLRADLPETSPDRRPLLPATPTAADSGSR